MMTVCICVARRFGGNWSSRTDRRSTMVIRRMIITRTTTTTAVSSSFDDVVLGVQGGVVATVVTSSASTAAVVIQKVVLPQPRTLATFLVAEDREEASVLVFLLTTPTISGCLFLCDGTFLHHIKISEQLVVVVEDCHNNCSLRFVFCDRLFICFYST